MPSITITGNVSREEALEELRKLSERYDPDESLEEILLDLQRFEQKYGMSTLEFYARFRAGEIGDAQEFMLWATLYEAYVELTQPYMVEGKLAA